MTRAPRAALVTGGSRGIGRAVCLALARAGTDVALTHLGDTENARATGEEIEALGARALAFEADVADFNLAQKVVNETREGLGRLDILVANAGISRDAAVWKMSEEQWDDVMAVNLKGAFNYIRAAAPLFREQEWGRVVVTTSINALRGKFGLSNYSASKAGLVGLVYTAARELGPKGVTVNGVAPGLVLTELTKGLPPEMVARAKEEAALKRLGEPEDVANLVAFLCLEEARHITGQIIAVDGGQTV